MCRMSPFLNLIILMITRLFWQSNNLLVAARNKVFQQSAHTHADAFELFIDKELKQSWLRRRLWSVLWKSQQKRRLPHFFFFYRFFRYYSATILQMSGVRDDRLAIWLAGLTTLTNFLFTLLGVWLVERVGRRKLTLGSITGETQRAAGSSAAPTNRTNWSSCHFSTGTCLSLSLLAVGFLMTAQHSPPVTVHPLDPVLANSTCSSYQWVKAQIQVGFGFLTHFCSDWEQHSGSHVTFLTRAGNKSDLACLSWFLLKATFLTLL